MKIHKTKEINKIKTTTMKAIKNNSLVVIHGLKRKKQ